MRAFSYKTPHALADFQIRENVTANPSIGTKDVLVRVKAFSFNPVDYKQRQKRIPKEGKDRVILGWDGAGVIEQIGTDVIGFAVGDEVYYAGDLTRDGSYAELQAVDYRLIAHKPKSLSFAEAAAVPLTALTAWEALLERNFIYARDTKILIIGGAGGVGSMAIQLLKANTPATIIATASRPDTISWCKDLGADHVIGRHIKKDLQALGIGEVDIIFGTTHTADYLDILPEILRPFGHLCVIDDPDAFDIRSFKLKAQSVHWELMFTKSMYDYKPETQGAFLQQLAAWIDAGTVRSTLNLQLDASEENIKQAHHLLETGQSLGKIVMVR